MAKPKQTKAERAAYMKEYRQTRKADLKAYSLRSESSLSLPPELTALAKVAAQKALEKLCEPGIFDGISPEKIAMVLKAITDNYNLLSPMDGKTGQNKVPYTVVSALLGNLDK